ncbi:MAG: prepilin-type N-terminal cleavage/methylation domain-containing protein [Verrucomicrobiota bacterium]
MGTPPHTPAARRAFTLIELLTVIAIIGILAAILIPVVGKVRVAAAKSACTGNLRELASASLLFANDHKHQLPTRDSGQHWRDWAHPHVYHQNDYVLFRPYLGDAQGDRETVPALFCPGPLRDYRGPQNYFGTEGLFITYAYFNMRRVSPAVLTAYGTTGNDLRRTDTIPPDFPLWGCLTIQIGSNHVGHSNPLTAERFEGQNVAHADGSVRWHPESELVPFLNEGSNVYYGPGS